MELILEPLNCLHNLIACGSKQWSCHPIAATMPRPRRELPLKAVVNYITTHDRPSKPGSTTNKVDFRLASMILAKQPKIRDMFRRSD